MRTRSASIERWTLPDRPTLVTAREFVAIGKAKSFPWLSLGACYYKPTAAETPTMKVLLSIFSFIALTTSSTFSKADHFPYQPPQQNTQRHIAVCRNARRCTCRPVRQA